DRDAARFFFLQPIGIRAGQRTDERALPVIDMPGRPDDDRLHTSHFIRRTSYFALHTSYLLPLPHISLALAGSLLSAFLALRRRLAASRPAFAFTHAFEDLDEAEVHLPHFHVDADDLDLHLVAEPIDLVRVLAAQHMRALDEPVIVIGHRRDMHHALDEVLDQFDEQTER